MLKYYKEGVTCSEVPDEISLYIPLSGCRIRCPKCNSKWLWEFEGKELTPAKFLELLNKREGITCVCIGGGEGDFTTLNSLFYIAKRLKGLKTCWYTGLKEVPENINLEVLDYVKVGPYVGKALNEEGTNQKFYSVSHLHTITGKVFNPLEDITYKFQRRNVVMFSISKKQFLEGDTAICIEKVSLLGITLYKKREETSSRSVVKEFLKINNKKVKGFNNEN